MWLLCERAPSARAQAQIKNEGLEEVQSDLLDVLPDWLQDFRNNLVDDSSPTKPREMLRLRIETLPVILMNREQKWNRGRAGMVSTLNFEELRSSAVTTRVRLRRGEGMGGTGADGRSLPHVLHWRQFGEDSPSPRTVCVFFFF